MKRYALILAGILALLVGIGLVVRMLHPAGEMGATSTPQPGIATISDGTITIAYDPTSFGLATTEEQVVVHSYIPPCDQGFQYCFYYAATSTYTGTNFEAAGVRMDRRQDKDSQDACIESDPNGFSAYSGNTPAVVSTSDQTVSSLDVGDAGAGHYTNGMLYRLWTSGRCYEIETRIGETQYANYPEGAIKKFTDADRARMQSLLRDLVASITIKNGERIILPE